MRRVELPNNTPEQVREYVMQAQELASELVGTTDPSWSAIFRAAYEGFSGKQILFEQPQAVDLSSILQNGRR